MKKLISLTLALSFLATPSFANNNSPSLVKIIKNSDQTFTFERCEAQATDRCVTMGAKQKYTREELVSARKKLRNIAIAKGAGVGTVAATAAFFILGYTVQVAFSEGNSILHGVARVFGLHPVGWVALVGSTIFATATASGYIKAANPARQWRKSKTLSDDVLANSGEIKVKNLKEYVELLEEALNGVR